MPTTISVSEELADELYDRKGRGESYEDVAWRLIEHADAYQELQATEEGEEDIAREDTQADAQPEPVGDDVTDAEPAGEGYQPLDDGALFALDLPGSGEKLKRRQEAVRAAFEYIKENGKATPSDLKDDVYPEHDGEYASARSWWKNLVYPSFGELADGYGVLERADTTGVWTYTGEPDE